VADIPPLDPNVAGPVDNPPAPAGTFWQRRVVGPVVAQLKQGITPEKIALTIAVGSALANFPFVGTMWLCLLAGIVLKLNQPIIQAVNVLFTPLHLFLIPNYFYWGNKLFGAPQVRLGMRNSVELMWNMLLHDPGLFAHRFGLMVFHATVVWAAIAPLWITIIYYSARTTLREIVRVRTEAAAKAVIAAAAAGAVKNTDPSDHPVP
jgi:uncharacterized protein (DUF2062 family)